MTTKTKIEDPFNREDIINSDPVLAVAYWLGGWHGDLLAEVARIRQQPVEQIRNWINSISAEEKAKMLAINDIDELFMYGIPFVDTDKVLIHKVKK